METKFYRLNRAEYVRQMRIKGAIAWEAANCCNFEQDKRCALILACIDKGITSRRAIIHSVHRLSGVSTHQIGRILTKMTGTDPAKFLWSFDDDQEYKILPFC